MRIAALTAIALIGCNNPRAPAIAPPVPMVDMATEPVADMANATSDVGATDDMQPAPDLAITLLPMVPVPAGSFLMGCPTGFPTCQLDEQQHTVAISAFSIDKTEVTQASYQQCIQSGACTPPLTAFTPASTPNLPVVYVSWDQATAYCAWQGKRLPTEAEWEYAARGTDENHIYPWGNGGPSCALANYKACNTTAVDATGVRTQGASPFGAIDMAGNGLEWVQDWYSASYYPSSPASNPQGPATGAYRAARGGSFLNDAQNIVAFIRSYGTPNAQSDTLTFRCAR